MGCYVLVLTDEFDTCIVLKWDLKWDWFIMFSTFFYLVFQPGSDSGTTAVVALIRGKQLIVANAGDSRCVVSERGKAVDMSYDHKPEDELELARIKNAGGKVTMDGRVNGGLNLSRAIGVYTLSCFFYLFIYLLF